MILKKAERKGNEAEVPMTEGLAPRSAPDQPRSPKTRIPGAGGQGAVERGHDLPGDQAPRVEPKRLVGAAERDEFLRSIWRAMVAGRTRVNRVVFVDERSTNTSLSPLYAHSPKE
jgi:hypothetical protein